jgi:uroporphyrinogen-III decarboxylase
MNRETIDERMSVRNRVLAVLQGRRPDHLPFIDRFEVWYACHSRGGTLPEEFQGMSVTEIHRAVGMGQQKYLVPYALKLHGVEVVASFNGEVFYHEKEPVMEFFCGMFDFLDYETPGLTVTELITPVGKLRAQHGLLAENVATGTEHYIKEHLIKEEADYRTVEYLVERAEFVPRYEKVTREEAKLGDIGYVVPMTPRIPFQQMLLEYLGEIPFFYALHDSPRLVRRLMTVLDEQLTEILHRLADLQVPYLEFPDNLDGVMSNPKLFAEHCLPYYQRYCEILHGQAKKVGSHTDGNVRPLLALLAESGLDVCESFTPAPLTQCPFEEAWNAWRDGPIIWGGIPSVILWNRTSEQEFRDFVERLLATIGDQLIILGVGDMVMGHNSIRRVKYIVDRVEGRVAPA